MKPRDLAALLRRAAAAKDRLDQARQVGDTTGIMIAMVALTGDCPARKKA